MFHQNRLLPARLQPVKVQCLHSILLHRPKVELNHGTLQLLAIKNFQHLKFHFKAVYNVPKKKSFIFFDSPGNILVSDMYSIFFGRLTMCQLWFTPLNVLSYMFHQPSSPKWSNQWNFRIGSIQVGVLKCVKSVIKVDSFGYIILIKRNQWPHFETQVNDDKVFFYEKGFQLWETYHIIW